MLKLHLPTISQFAALMMLNISNAVFQLLVIPILIHYATPTKMGIYFIALSFGVLASILVNFGTSQTAVVELRRVNEHQEKLKINIETLAIEYIHFYWRSSLHYPYSLFSKMVFTILQ